MFDLNDPSDARPRQHVQHKFAYITLGGLRCFINILIKFYCIQKVNIKTKPSCSIKIFFNKKKEEQNYNVIFIY